MDTTIHINVADTSTSAARDTELHPAAQRCSRA